MTSRRHKRGSVLVISRLRKGTDCSGITTLVTLIGCPLRCKYCLNKKCHEPVYEADDKTPRQGIMLLTPKELYELELKISIAIGINFFLLCKKDA